MIRERQDIAKFQNRQDIVRLKKGRSANIQERRDIIKQNIAKIQERQDIASFKKGRILLNKNKT